MFEIRFSPNGKNRTPDVVEALRCAPDNTILLFENGVYDFYKLGAFEDYFSPSCNTSSDKWVIFPILRKKHLIIDGGGSVFLFHDRIFPFIVQHSEDITLKNFSIDFSFPRYVNAITEAATKDEIRIRILDRDISYSVNEMNNICFSVENENFETCEKRFFLQEVGGINCFLVAGTHFYELDNPPAPVFYCDASQNGDCIVLRKNEKTDFVPNFTPDKFLAVSYDEDRMNDAVFLDRTKDISIESVTVFRSAGMGIVGNCCENLCVNNFVIEPHPKRNDMFSTTADGMLLTNFTGLIHIKNCKLHNTMDDAMSIHGFYAKVIGIMAPNKILVRFVHPSQSGIKPYSTGDIVTFSDGENLCETIAATVRYAYTGSQPDHIVMCFQEPIFEFVKSGDWVENKTKMPEVIIEDSEFDTFPAIRIGNPKKTVFRNNTVKNGLFLINDLLSYWGASGCTHNLSITENVFENSGIGFISRDRADAMPHSDITIESNTFKNCENTLSAAHAHNIRFSKNVLINSADALFDDSCKSVIKE